jgi:hypothetical protein
MRLKAVPADVANRLDWKRAKYGATVMPDSADSPYVSSDSGNWAFQCACRKRMAHPVGKQFQRSGSTSLHQRIRPVGVAPAKMEIRASRSS